MSCALQEWQVHNKMLKASLILVSYISDHQRISLTLSTLPGPSLRRPPWVYHTRLPLCTNATLVIKHRYPMTQEMHSGVTVRSENLSVVLTVKSDYAHLTSPFDLQQPLQPCLQDHYP